MGLKILYQDSNLLVIDKPAGITVYPTERIQESLIDKVLKEFPCLKNVGKPPRYGLVHRLDKDTSGIVLIAKNNETLAFLQKQFKEKQVEKRYLALVVGNIKEQYLTVETLIGRDLKNKMKQRIYLPAAPESQKKGMREAKTKIRVLKRLTDGKNYYTLIEAAPDTGRKHQIRVHMQYIHHPIAGDKIYRFKGQPCPKGLLRHFLHAKSLKIHTPKAKQKQFASEMPEDLKNIIETLKEIEE